MVVGHLYDKSKCKPGTRILRREMLTGFSGTEAAVSGLTVGNGADTELGRLLSAWEQGTEQPTSMGLEALPSSLQVWTIRPS